MRALTPSATLLKCHLMSINAKKRLGGPLGKLTDTLAGGERVGCPLFKSPTSALSLSGLGLQLFTSRLSPPPNFYSPSLFEPKSWLRP